MTPEEKAKAIQAQVALTLEGLGARVRLAQLRSLRVDWDGGEIVHITLGLMQPPAEHIEFAPATVEFIPPPTSAPTNGHRPGEYDSLCGCAACERHRNLSQHDMCGCITCERKRQV